MADELANTKISFENLKSNLETVKLENKRLVEDLKNGERLAA